MGQKIQEQIEGYSPGYFKHLVDYNPSNPVKYTGKRHITTLTEEYNSLLTEELGIAYNVKKVTLAVKNLIYKDIPNLKPTNNYERKQYLLQNYEFIGYLPIDFRYISCDDEESYEKADKSCWVDLDSDYYIKKGNNNIYQIYDVMLFIRSPFFNGKILEENFYGNVFHEIEHIYQEYQKLLSLSKHGQYQNAEVIKKSFLKPQNKSNVNRENLYKFAIKNLTSNPPYPNYFVQYVSWVFYMIGWDEQDGFVNQLYGQMMKMKDLNMSNFDEKYRQTETYFVLEDLKNVQTNLSNWGLDANEHVPYQEMINYLDQNGITFRKDEIQTLVDRILIRFSKKIGKVLEKIKVDKRFIPGRTRKY